jgi:integrase
MQHVAKRRRKSLVRDEVGGEQRKRIDRLDPRPVKIRGTVLWQVDLGNVTRNGKLYRARKTFRTQREAKAFADVKIIERSNLGTRGLGLSDYLRGQAWEADRLLADYPGLSIIDCVHEAIAKRMALTRSETVARAFEAFMHAKSADGLRQRYLGDLRYRVGRFAREFGDRKIADISPADIDRHLREFGGAPLTRNTVRMRLRVFFRYAQQCGWIEANPVDSVPKVKAASKPPGILIVDEATKLLEFASEETLPFFAIGLFAGLRTAEIERLKWQYIKWDEALIEVPALSSKTASRRLVTMPPNLYQWLEPYQGKHGPVCPPNMYYRSTLDRQRAGLCSWPSNCLRHSYASYHLAFHRDAPALSLELGHMTPGMVFQHYREVVRPAEAERYWKIVPAQSSATISSVA